MTSKAVGRDAEWLYMDTLRPPVYVCLRRQRASDGTYPRFELDGRLDKAEWAHVPWSDPFVDIEGTERKPCEYPLTRMKMMYDDEQLYIGAELIETKIWGTIREKNATMYHENDFEVFLNPDGSRHNYYELELNCLNTIWELVLNRPYKDGYSIQNPHNLETTRTAVYVDGVTNSPLDECRKWCVEVAISLRELVQFDRLRRRIVHPGDVWRVNFSRVQYQLTTVLDDETQQLKFEKVPDTREDNIVWAPTGVIDIHRPEKWGFVVFSSARDEHEGIVELNQVMEAYLCEQIAMERVLDTVYYDQRAYFKENESYAESLGELYGSAEAFPWVDIIDEFKLQLPDIKRRRKPEADRMLTPHARHGDGDAPRRRSYVAKLDPDDGEAEQEAKKRTPCLEYTVSIKSETQEWNMEHDARLWKSVH